MLQSRFLKTLQKFRMIEKGDHVLTAVSGGEDSVTLLHLLLEIRQAWKLKLGILHVNHQLRGKASKADEAFVKELGKKWDIPVFVERVNVSKLAKSEKLSIEEAARKARYHFFEKMAEAKRAQKVALAHTLDDQAETVLMRVVMGTGLEGLQAIRPKRRLAAGGYFIRPMIEIPKADIKQFTRARRIKFREDETNKSTQFLRNRIRLKLLPFLEKSFNPRVKPALARLPHLLNVDLQFLDETADLFYKRLARETKMRSVQFPKQSFMQLRPSIQYRLLERVIRSLAGAGLDFEHWNAFSERLETARRFRIQLPKGVLATVTATAVRIHLAKEREISFSYPLTLGEERFIPEIKIRISCEEVREKPKVFRKSDTSYELFDAGKLQFPLTVRSRKLGDRFQPLGQKKPLKLKGLLINKKIPAETRSQIPVIESSGEIVWVGGIAIAEPFKIRVNTRQVVRISLVSGYSL